ncbi:MAG: VanZ family protein [Chitinophagaceae bacterium]
MSTEQPAKQNSWRNLTWFVFFVYSAVLVKIIVIKNLQFFIESLRQTWRHRGYHSSSATQNWVAFRNIKILLFSKNVSFATAFLNVGGNIILFIPFGILIPVLLNGANKFLKTLFLGFFLSACFEFFQLLTGCGEFDVDDIILNTTGTFLGLACYSLIKVLRPTHSSASQRITP